MDKALAFIDANLHRPISLDEVARAVCRSRSSVSHQFKNVLGCSFKQTVIDRKTRHAEQLLRDRPGLTVREAARAVGYDDPYHFSRLFHKYRGCPPREVRPDDAS